MNTNKNNVVLFNELEGKDKRALINATVEDVLRENGPLHREKVIAKVREALGDTKKTLGENEIVGSAYRDAKSANPVTFRFYGSRIYGLVEFDTPTDLTPFKKVRKARSSEQK